MPTGYTSKIHDGKDATLAGYLRDCARAFILDLREEPDDAPIPARSTYKDEVIADYEAKVQDALGTIYRLEGLTDAQCAEQAQAEHEETVARLTGYNDAKKVLEARYRDVLAQLDTWEPPPVLNGVRDFMREQLVKSIEFDCQPYDLPTAQLPAEWRTAQKEQAQRLHEMWSADLAKQRASRARGEAFMEALHVELNRLGAVPPQDQSGLSTDTGESA